MMLVEGDRTVVFRVDDESKGGRRGFERPLCGVGENSGPEAAALEALIDGETADADSRNRGVLLHGTEEDDVRRQCRLQPAD